MTPTQAFNEFKENLPQGVSCVSYQFKNFKIVNLHWLSNGVLFTKSKSIESTTLDKLHFPQDFFSDLLNEIRYETNPPDAG